ncbi:MAG: hypothetical protein MUO77_03150, partial [Anaerolineales bacterium]|nr:hypothetical protein [Anaerolineales bacterium]
MTRSIKFISLALVIVGVCTLTFYAPLSIPTHAQQSTGSVPTVTGTPSGPMATVYLDLGQIDVYAGPSSFFYPAIGVLLAGQQVPALGRSNDEQWIMIRYPGVPKSVAWVYAPYVSLLRGGSLPELPAPPTPTLISTPTINPTLAAAFIAQATSTRLPTFTPPAPLVAPAFVDQTTRPSRVPMGLMIFGLA